MQPRLACAATARQAAGRLGGRPAQGVGSPARAGQLLHRVPGGRAPGAAPGPLLLHALPAEAGELQAGAEGGTQAELAARHGADKARRAAEQQRPWWRPAGGADGHGCGPRHRQPVGRAWRPGQGLCPRVCGGRGGGGQGRQPAARRQGGQGRRRWAGGALREAGGGRREAEGSLPRCGWHGGFCWTSPCTHRM
jgi:hypothetical protein